MSWKALRRNNGRFLVDALCPLDDLIEACHLELPEVTSDTTGGLIVELLGHIPQPGEKIKIGRHELTVLDAEPTRVRRVEVQEFEADLAEGDISARQHADAAREESPPEDQPSGSAEPTSRSA